MEKVRCIKCGSIGYTAAPNSVRCSKCGGKHEIVEMDYRNCKLYNKNRNHFIERFTLTFKGNEI